MNSVVGQRRTGYPSLTRGRWPPILETSLGVAVFVIGQTIFDGTMLVGTKVYFVSVTHTKRYFKIVNGRQNATKKQFDKQFVSLLKVSIQTGYALTYYSYNISFRLALDAITSRSCKIGRVNQWQEPGGGQGDHGPSNMI